jgi:integrase/recombinase XerC
MSCLLCKSFSTVLHNSGVDSQRARVSTSGNIPMHSATEFNRELAGRYERWLTVQHYSPETIRVYVRTVKDFSRFMNRKAVTQATHLDIKEFLVMASQRGHITYTLKHELHALRVFFDFLNMGGLVPWVAPRFVKIRSPKPRLPHVLSETQIRGLLEAAINARERALIEILYGTGARPGEIATMRVEDIDFNAGRIRATGKNGTRFILFGTPVAKAIRTYLSGRIAGYLFTEGRPRQRIRVYTAASGGWRCRWKEYDDFGRVKQTRNAFIGYKEHLTKAAALAKFQRIAKSCNLQRPTGAKPLRADSISRAIRNIGARIGMRVTPYYLRHSYATHMLDRGADIRVIQELLGHGRLTSTQVYTHVSKTALVRTFIHCHPRSK